MPGKYRKIRLLKKNPPRTFLVDKADVETIQYDEPKEDLFVNESILAAANNVFDFNKYKKEQAEALKEMKKQ